MGAAGGLRISVGQHSDRGRRAVNQDFHGVAAPAPSLVRSKGIAVALADGIGSSDVSQVASEFAVMGVLDDYYCTSEAWSVKRSLERVITATNAWLHSRTRQGPHPHDMDRGYVCSLSAVVFKAATAHVFHVGDVRVYRVHPAGLEPLTEDHRVLVAGGQSHLSRAVGFNPQIEIDHVAVPIEADDAFLLASDGVHEHVDEAFMAAAVQRGRADPDAAARAIVEEALRRGSPDNVTAQVVVVEAVAQPEAWEPDRRLQELPPPPLLEPGTVLDGYRIVRELHASSRSHVYLAVDAATQALTVLKAPAIDRQDDPACLERFLLEEWIARRIDSPHVVKAAPRAGPRTRLYVALEHVDGGTLTQWMLDHPRPGIETVRRLVEQIGQGLQAFHRREMLHQDLRPDNVMVDASGTVKIIDFGATRVAGIAESDPRHAEGGILGTEQYAAPEYFLGAPGTVASDLYALAVVTYQMLAGGRLPYGAAVSRARTPAAQRKLCYASVLDEQREIPVWIDDVLRKALHPDPLRRHEALSEYLEALRRPSTAAARARPALIERHPVRFWRALAGVLALAVVALLLMQFGFGPR